jgi:hypothetical protein
MTNFLEIRKLPDSITINRDCVYRIYRDGIDMGDCFRGEDLYWHLNIPCAEIKIHGVYRNDLFEEAEILYDKFIKKNKGD